MDPEYLPTNSQPAGTAETVGGAGAAGEKGERGKEERVCQKQNKVLLLELKVPSIEIVSRAGA